MVGCTIFQTKNSTSFDKRLYFHKENSYLIPENNQKSIFPEIKKIWDWTNGDISEIKADNNGFYYKLTPGLNDGIYSFYDKETDSLIFKSTMSDGVQSGKQSYFYEKDAEFSYKILFECTFDKGKKEGYAAYHLYDKLESHRIFWVKYNNDKIDSVFVDRNKESLDTLKIWINDFNRIINSRYKNMENSYLKVYSDKMLENSIIEEGIILNGQKNYLWIKRDLNGRIIEKAEFYKGRKYGFCFDYHWLNDSIQLVNIHLNQNGEEFIEGIKLEW